MDAIEPGDAWVVVNDTTPHVETGVSGRRFWVPFIVTVPTMKTMKVDASILLPSNPTTGVALYHATDIKFYEAPEGKNVLCMTEDVDLQRTYKTTFSQSQDILTHMQVYIKVKGVC